MSPAQIAAVVRAKRIDSLHRAIERHGCVVERFGSAWRVYGREVDILVADLADIVPAELKPPRNGELLAMQARARGLDADRTEAQQ